MGWLSKIFGRRPSKQTATEPGETYLRLRSLALGLRETDPGLVGTTADEPMAILMESGLESGATYTVVCVADGSTSLYFSNGGGIIGAGAHAPVAAASRTWLERATADAPLMSPTTDFPLPATG